MLAVGLMNGYVIKRRDYLKKIIYLLRMIISIIIGIAITPLLIIVITDYFGTINGPAYMLVEEEQSLYKQFALFLGALFLLFFVSIEIALKKKIYKNSWWLFWTNVLVTVCTVALFWKPFSY